jgi:hypothetical protein
VRGVLLRLDRSIADAVVELGAAHAQDLRGLYGSTPLTTRTGPIEADLIDAVFDPTRHPSARNPAVASLRRCLRF